jgi:hypothetical protein
MRTQSTTLVIVKIPARSTSQSAMSEAQFELLLDAVRTAVEFTPQSGSQSNDLLKTTNDNHPAWPLVPFPEEWYAAN